jgi:hypothetical protein
MIGALRRIRRTLLSDNKLSKYLVYAAGEIVLVVLGILIAIQINNWNEIRKDRNQERVYLERVLLDLELDHESLNMAI